MYYKKYGSTDMKVSAVGFGCMRFNDDDIKAGNLDKCADVVLYAHEKGINYFDTAPLYCYDNKSETITGIALSQLPRDSYYVSTKGNFGTAIGDNTKGGFRRRLEQSLKDLKVDYIDVYHLWCILNLEGFEKLYDVMYEMCEEAKAEGLIRHIAFSSHMPGAELETVVQRTDFAGMLIGYNALNYRLRQPGINAAYSKGMGIVAMNPLGGGLIPSNPDKFTYLTDGSSLNVAGAALRFVASHREISVTLVGCNNTKDVDDACKSVVNLIEDSADNIYKEYKNKGESINDFCTGCGYCDSCPVGVQIPKFMDAYNMVLLGDSFENRLKWHWDVTKEQAGECTACGHCEELCTQHLPIIERLKYIAGK